jgi:hypothetical protein
MHFLQINLLRGDLESARAGAEWQDSYYVTKIGQLEAESAEALAAAKQDQRTLLQVNEVKQDQRTRLQVNEVKQDQRTRLQVNEVKQDQRTLPAGE